MFASSIWEKMMNPTPSLPWPSLPAMASRVLVLGLAVFALVSVAQPVSRDGLLASWSFDEFDDEELTTPDGSECGNVMKVNNIEVVKGVSGAAMSFDLRGGWGMSTDMFPVDEGLTVEVWFRPGVARPSGFAAIARKEGAYALRFGELGKLGFLVWVKGAPKYVHTEVSEWDTSAWYHAVGTYDGKQMRLFVNGEEDPRSPLAQEGFVSDGGSPIGIGSCRGRYAFTGAIDEVRVYSRAITPAEVRASHRAGIQAMTEQANLTVEPRKLGRSNAEFRKPLRPVGMVKPGFVWIDAEDFASYGGWTLDTQFVHLMGSGYLLATGVGTPVDDATTEFELKKSGTYRVWVRGRNWVKEHAPGRFRIVVNGRGLEKEFGAAESDKWVWESAGDVALAAGKVSLALRDTTGYYGRCDAIVLTTDKTYVPPAERAEICAERARLTGLSLTPEFAGEFDVIVVGAGTGGCPAAIAAARTGAKTALIQNRPVLGGNASDECGVPMNGAASHHPNARETGIPEDVHRTKAFYGARAYSEPFAVLCKAEPNLTVFLNQHVFDVEMKDASTIATAKAVDTLTGGITVYRAKQFVDCTGDGWVGYFAKATFRKGREASSEFGESLAPAKADGITMSGCLMGNGLGFRAAGMGREMPFPRPPWAHDIPKLDGFGRRVRRITGGEWWNEHPGTIDDIWEAEMARDELIRIIFGYWDYIKNKSRFQAEASTYGLIHIPHMDAKRESRRLEGDYLLNQNDCENGRVFKDAISYGGWPMDVHHPKGMFSGSEGSFDCNKHVPIYTIPYRSLYSKNIDNLLFAGRCASVTHIALGTIRVESTLATMGQAAGTAAAWCARKSITPREIYERYMKAFQQKLLKDDQTIPGIVNEDAADLARTATVSASSTAAFRYFSQKNVRKDRSHPMDHDRGMIFRATPGMLSEIRVLLGSTNPKATEITLHVRGAKDKENTSSTTDLVTATASVPARGETWVTFSVGKTVASPCLWFWLPKTEGISWRLMTGAPHGTSRMYGAASSNTWTLRNGEFYAFAADPPLQTPTTYHADNVVNGKIRMWDGETNMWASDPREPFPQWIELDFGAAKDVSSVYLTFDTNMAPRIPTAARPPECVADYEVSYLDGAKWKTVATAKGNWLRRRIHRFDTVKARKVRLTVKRTNGEKSARVFEIRAYHE